MSTGSHQLQNHIINASRGASWHVGLLAFPSLGVAIGAENIGTREGRKK